MNDSAGPGHSREYVSLRDYTEQRFADLRTYFDRLLQDHAELHVKEATVAQREAALVRTVLEQRMVDHDLRHVAEHKADLRAVDQARDAIEGRLEKLNELRQEVTRDRGEFITRGTFEAKLQASEKDRADLAKAVESIRQELATARGRQAAYAAVGGVLLVVVPFLILLVFRIMGGT